MRNGVFIGGVWLSREAVETAYKELQTPEFQIGDVVSWGSDLEGVVVGGEVERLLEAKHGALHRAQVRVMCTKGGIIGSSYSPMIANVKKVR